MIVPSLIHIFNPTSITIITSIGILPFLFRNRETCYDDNDCPFFMKCCILGIEKILLYS